MATARLHFLPWNLPLVPQLVAWLAQGWDPAGPLDLSRTLAIVPTREAGRRLREGLAAHAAAAGRAVFPPQVCTPEAVLVPETGGSGASPLQTILAWSAVLREIELEEFPDVFPQAPPERNFGWSMRLGRQLAQLQSTLAEAGWRLQSAAQRLSAHADFPELARWRQMAVLEQRLDEILAAAGRRDPQAVKIEASKAPALPPQIDRLVVLAAPDPLPIAVRALDALSGQVGATEVIIFAPPEESAGFDSWGRPRTELWTARPPPLADFPARVRLEADPEAEAEQIAALVSGYRASPGALAVGVADPEVAAPLMAGLSGRELPVYNPSGTPRRNDGFFQLLNALADLMRSDEFRMVEAVARCPDILAWLEQQGEGRFSAARWLAGLDVLRSRHLPATLPIALEQARNITVPDEVAAGLRLIGDLRALLQPSFAGGATAALAMIFEGRRASESEPFAGQLAESAAAWMEVVRECDEAAAADLPPADWWDLALRVFGDQLRFEEKPPAAVELQGWIELLWEEAPHLVIAGMNENAVPGAVAGDPFLPESLRELLGLKTNAGRLARDAYLLQAFARCREPEGRLDLLLAKTSAAGEPLRPSRLLLLCPDDALAPRVRHLFRAVAPAGPPLPWTRAWRLTPPRGTAPASVRVTALRAWLDCPFRFFLQHVLKMEAVDPAKSEMDQFDFGTLCHAALEAMGRETSLHACTEPEPLRDFLLGALDRAARRKFGDLLSLPLLVQVESARQRLSWLAEVQAREQADGWRIVEVEKSVTITIEGLEVRAKVDRIDRHSVSGAVRVLDYKTSDTAVSPAAAHLRPPAQMRELPEWARVVYEGKERVWADLQLPLYRQALAGEYPTLSECGYFNLPKASADARLEWWQPYPRELQDSAAACAAGVCRAIRAAEFWPPRDEEDPDRDPYAALFQHGVRASIALPHGL